MPGKAREKFLALQVARPSYPEVGTYLQKIGRSEEAVRQGISAYFGGKYQQAIEQLSEASKSNNEDSHIYAALACAYATKYLLSGGEEKELYGLAVEAMRKAKQIDGNIHLDASYISPKIIALLNQR
jgi:tetratricopeptide (TPR) repeat protein